MTSIEWLIEQYNKYRPGQMPRKNFKEVCEQAKQMHKQEIIDAIKVGSQFDRDYLYGYPYKAEQYYQETFVNEKSNDRIVD